LVSEKSFDASKKKRLFLKLLAKGGKKHGTGRGFWPRVVDAPRSARDKRHARSASPGSNSRTRRRQCSAHASHVVCWLSHRNCVSTSRSRVLSSPNALGKSRKSSGTGAAARSGTTRGARMNDLRGSEVSRGADGGSYAERGGQSVMAPHQGGRQHSGVSRVLRLLLATPWGRRVQTETVP